MTATGPTRPPHSAPGTQATPQLAALTQDDLVNRIAQVLTEAIMKGGFAPGARLTEATIARDLGVSRAPVREAARLLENRGLVVAVPRRGFFVRSFDAADLDQIYDLRMCLERHAGGLLAGRLTPEMDTALSAQVQLLHRLAEAGDGDRQIEEDLKFHRMICVFAGNRRLLKVFDELTAETRYGIAMIGRLYDDPHEIARTHEPLLDALRSGDATSFAEASDYHIGTARQRVVAMFGPG
ncbi:GntR family transcriptional regulator [Tistrella mobilis]|uniref:Transcriptional regulator n=1 Tax=Tistrella mobilis (strain KA081020-065) TaxID=1110502 RepID=I3TH69_TISMK|nr:GntR family transcriptional regulator [Tistrella mobilis]AFK52107.1 transcriptional regulator [Tistrella mobilis KA081020-065]